MINSLRNVTASLVSRQSFGGSALNLADPDLELVDPTPNVHAMFVQFDKMFFWSRLHSRTIVKWSKRMYSCAGTCSYDTALCNITLSEPLLKLRPRKDLVETLLHEMIHAYCFLTNTDRDRDGHGPNFQGHMHRINRAAGLNISIYHDFHDEVKLYQTHWWRCDGVCQRRGPYFGIVKRNANRPPGPSDAWWKTHQASCGGKYTKIKEPEPKINKKATTTKNKKNNDNAKPVKNVNDISKYVNIIKKTENLPVTRPVLKDSNINTINTISNPTSPITVFKGEGKTISGGIRSFVDAAEAVRKAWANKRVSSAPIANQTSSQIANKTINSTPITKKHKATDFKDSPPAKMRKIDDFFPTASGILKDLYGDEIKVSKNNDSIIITAAKTDLVDCPICMAKISSKKINTHLDECLNKDVIESLSTDYKKTEIKTETQPNTIAATIIKTATEGQLLQTKPAFVKVEPSSVKIESASFKIEPGSSQDQTATKCACCGEIVSKSMVEHLDECLSFSSNNTTTPQEGASTSFGEIIVIDDDDDSFNESATLNATGTKFPCPCCFEMIESAEMNGHLDSCLC